MADPTRSQTDRARLRSAVPVLAVEPMPPCGVARRFPPSLRAEHRAGTTTAVSAVCSASESPHPSKRCSTRARRARGRAMPRPPVRPVQSRAPGGHRRRPDAIGPIIPLISWARSNLTSRVRLSLSSPRPSRARSTVTGESPSRPLSPRGVSPPSGRAGVAGGNSSVRWKPARSSQPIVAAAATAAVMAARQHAQA